MSPLICKNSKNALHSQHTSCTLDIWFSDEDEKFANGIQGQGFRLSPIRIQDNPQSAVFKATEDKGAIGKAWRIFLQKNQLGAVFWVKNLSLSAEKVVEPGVHKIRSDEAGTCPEVDYV